MKHVWNDKRDPDDHQQDSGPSHLCPKPQPIAFWMQRSCIRNGGNARNSKDWLEISKTDSAPGRCPDQAPGVAENEPAKIGGDAISHAAAQMKSFQRRTPKDQHRRQKDQHSRKADRDSCRRRPAKGYDHEPDRASRDQDENASTRIIKD